MSMDLIAFDIIDGLEVERNKKNYRHIIIYFNGRVEGLPGKWIIRNYAAPVLLRMQALERQLEEEKKYNKHLQERLGDLK